MQRRTRRGGTVRGIATTTPEHIPGHTGWTPGAGWSRAKEALGWPDLDDDPTKVAEFEEAERRADEEAERFWREHAA